jgi:hypothetical protein
MSADISNQEAVKLMAYRIAFALFTQYRFDPVSDNPHTHGVMGLARAIRFELECLTGLRDPTDTSGCQDR